MSWSDFDKNGALIERGDDTTGKVYGPDGQVIRDYTDTEKEAAAEAIALAAMVTDHESRIRALEDDLTALTREVKPDLPDAPTWDQLPRADWWMPDTLLSDGGKVWLNTSGTVLTTPPSGFPGQPSQWTRLFVEHGGAIDPEPEPGHPEGYVGTWSASADYKVGDVVDRGDMYYRAKVAHGAAYAGTWGPPLPSVWDVVGPVA